jgi:hypothetical protein
MKMPFRDFWRLYLDAHRRTGTRGMHYSATAVGVAGSVASVAVGEFLLAPLGIIVAVAMAVCSHWFIEKNQPLIMVNPFFGAVADLKMCWLAVTGGLAAEYVRLKLAPIGEPKRSPVGTVG